MKAKFSKGRITLNVNYKVSHVLLLKPKSIRSEFFFFPTEFINSRVIGLMWFSSLHDVVYYVMYTYKLIVLTQIKTVLYVLAQ